MLHGVAHLNSCLLLSHVVPAGQQLYSMMYSLARLDVYPGDSWLQSYVKAARSKQHQILDVDKPKLAWACGQLRSEQAAQREQDRNADTKNS